MRLAVMLLPVVLLGGCAAGTMTGAGQGGRADDGRSYAEVRSDQLLVGAVNRVLVRDKSVSATDIRVSARDGVVTLAGQVSSADAANRAVQLARGVDGVKDVVSLLRVSR